MKGQDHFKKREFWDLAKPNDCRAFLYSLRNGKPAKPVTAIRNDAGVTINIADMSDAEAVLYANQMLGIIKSHGKLIPGHVTPAAKS